MSHRMDHFWIDCGFIAKQAGSMYRAEGSEELRSVGDTESVCGDAAMSAWGNYGPTRCIAGIVGYVDLRLGSRAKGVPNRHIAVCDGRTAAFATVRPGATIQSSKASAGPGLYLDKGSLKVFPPS